jgi:YtkA-like
MVSSLVHVLIVTPVIFFWLRERRLGLKHDALAPGEPTVPGRRAALIGVVSIAAIALTIGVAWKHGADKGNNGGQATAAVVKTVRAGDLDVALLSPSGALREGRNSFTIEFRRTGTTTLADAGTVRASANMTMAGMAMSGGLEVSPTKVEGRYAVTGEFPMAGAWQMVIDWNGPAGQGSVRFEGSVQ